MGNPISKIDKNVKDEEPIEKGSLPSTPILTPKISRTQEVIIDPRSPSNNVVRTPLEVSIDSP